MKSATYLRAADLADSKLTDSKIIALLDKSKDVRRSLWSTTDGRDKVRQ